MTLVSRPAEYTHSHHSAELLLGQLHHHNNTQGCSASPTNTHTLRLRSYLLRLKFGLHKFGTIHQKLV